jgi:hypothetical protein
MGFWGFHYVQISNIFHFKGPPLIWKIYENLDIEMSDAQLDF